MRQRVARRLGVWCVKLAGALYALGLMLLGLTPQEVLALINPPKPETQTAPATSADIAQLQRIYRLAAQPPMVH